MCVIARVVFACTKDNTLNKYLTKYLLLGESAVKNEGGWRELPVIFAWVHLYYLGQWTEVDPEVKIPKPASHQCDALIWHLKYIQQDERVHDEWSHGGDMSAEFIRGIHGHITGLFHFNFPDHSRLNLTSNHLNCLLILETITDTTVNLWNRDICRQLCFMLKLQSGF